MNEYILYTALATVVFIAILVLSFFKGRSSATDGEQDEAAAQARQRPVVPEPINRDGGPRNRAIANRNARARMRVAQAQRHQEASDEEDPIDELGDEIALPEGKIGKKKLAKLQMKAEKRAMRENEERERQEKKEREEQKAEMRRQIEKEREEEEARREEEERLRREEQERKEQEEYEQMRVEFEVEEEGYEEGNTDEAQQSQLLKQFIDYIKSNKVVVLEDLAALFSLKTQAVIDRITELQKGGDLTGVIDDRGKFIYISREELESVAKFVKQRGRISISDLAEASNTLINLNPETCVKS